MALNDLIEQLRARRLSEVSEKKTHRKERPASVKPEAQVQDYSDRIRAEVYKRIIERYSDTIGLMEDKTIPELKALVNPEDEAVVIVKQRIFDGIKTEAGWEYSLEKDFPLFLRKALAYCNSLKPVNADLSVSYWLKPGEIVELGAADPFDKAIFLCSLLNSAGGNARVRVLELEGSVKHAVVFLEFAGKVLLLDPSCSPIPEEGDSEESVLQSHALEGKRVVKSLYEFNNTEYSDFGE